MSKAIEGAAMLGADALLYGALVLGSGGLAIAAAPIFNMLAVPLLVGGLGMEAAALSTALTANRGMGISTRQVAGPQQIIYGEQRVGGTIIYESTTGSQHDQYNYVIVIAGHEVDSIVNLYLDGRQVYWLGSGAGYSVRNGVGFGGVADNANHEGPDGQQYNFGGTGHSGIYCEARYGDQIDGDVIGGLTANDPTWAAVSGGSPWVGGCTYVYLKIEYNQTVFPNPPEVRFTVRGKNNIWDPRTGTYGYTSNSALCVADVILDTEFGLGDVEAFQDSGSLAALIAAANVCDELVSVSATASSEARYCCHYHYDAATPPGDAMAVMLQTMGGRISQPGGEWYITPAYWQGPSFTFDSNSLRGEVSWEPNRSQKDLFNRVNGTYIAANWPYNTATAPGSLSNLYDSNGFYNGFTSNTFPFAFQPSSFPQYAADPLHGYAADQYLQQDSRVLGAWASGTTYNLGDTVTYSGAIYRSLIASNVGHTPSTATADWAPYENLLPMELSLRGVLSVTQAQRLAKIALLRNRAQGSGTFPMSLAARGMQVCDVMQFTWSALGWTSKTLEVVRVHWSTSYDGDAPKETTEIQVQETNSSIYAWSPGTEELTVYDVPAVPQQQYRQPVAPTGMSLTSGASTAVTSPTGQVQPRIEVQWTTPADILTTSIKVQYALVTGGTPGPWIDAGSADISVNSFYIANVVAGLVYNVRICGVRGASGAYSAWVEIDGFTVTLTLSSIGNLGVGIGSLTGNALSGGAADILGVGFTVSVGSLSVSVSPGNYPLTNSYTGGTSAALVQGELYFVYYIDSSFAGGAVTAIATQNQNDYLNRAGYFLIDSIALPMAGSGGGAVYQPSTVVTSGTRTTTNPSGPLSTGSGSSVVSAYANAPTSLPRTYTFGSCIWGGFASFTSTAGMTLSVTAAVSITGTGTGMAVLTVYVGSTATTLMSVTASAGSTVYTFSIPTGTDLSTITIEADPSAVAVLHSGNTELVNITVSSITIS